MKSPDNDKQGGAGPDRPQICPKCGKRIAAGDQAGDLASHLFQDFNCSCRSTEKDHSPNASAHSSNPPKFLQKLGAITSTIKLTGSKRLPKGEKTANESDDFCPRCGLKIAPPSLPGSLTGYLFQDTRCKCAREADFTQGAMTGKFWKLKQAGLGTTFTNVHSEDKSRSGNTIDLAAGAIIGGAYQIIELIGRGGMGEVYLARHLTLGKKCALKLIPPEQVTELSWRRFQQEAKAIAKLDHINLVKVSDLGIHEGCLPFYAMEFVAGHTLADMLAQHGPMPLNTSIEVFTQICDGVDHAHRAGIIHRDIKPANIMVSKSAGGKLSVKVLDFGLAKLTQQDRDKQSLTAVGDIFGSPFYMSPEQCSGEKIDTRSDIYSIGCTLFECLTGQPPFTGHLASAIVFSHQEAAPPSMGSIVGSKSLPESIEVVMAKLLRKNPVERYQTLTELKGDLEKVAKGENVQPFYMSRSKGTAEPARPAVADNHERKSSRPGRKADNTLRRRFLIIAPIIISALAVLGLYRSIVAPKPVTTAVKSKSKIEASELFYINKTDSAKLPPGYSNRDTALETQLEELPPITRKVDTARGTITFNFPSVALGALVWHRGLGDVAGFDSSKEDERTVEAKGDTTVPAGRDLLFKLPELQFNEGWHHPSFLSKFGNDYFQGLYLGGIANSLNILGSDADKKDDARRLTEIVKTVGSWTSLNSIELNNCYISDEVIIAFDKFKNLRQLSVSNSLLNAKVMSHRSFMKSLTRLELNDMADVDEILTGLKGSTAIRELQLHSTDGTAGGLKVLATCPSLKFLQFTKCQTTAAVFEALGAIKSLKHVAILQHQLKQEEIPLFSKLDKLQSVTFDASGWSIAQQNQIRKVLPHAIFDRSTSRSRPNADDL